jgi:8-oxo-dGTP pyrophosphatase MutT (NUDIX family)
VEAETAKGITVTFTPVHNGQFLFVQRAADDDVLPGYWCFPGGKVEVGETLSAAIERECLEEIGVRPSGRAFFVDSYLLGSRLGVHFAVEVDSDRVILDEMDDCAWVDKLTDLHQFTPRIPGIDTHLHYIIEQLDRLSKLEHADPKDAELVRALCWRPLAQFDLVEHRFLNK